MTPIAQRSKVNINKLNLEKVNYKAGEAEARGLQVQVYPWLHSMYEAYLGYMRSGLKNWSIKTIHGTGEDNYIASHGLILTNYLNILFKKDTQEINMLIARYSKLLVTGNANFFISSWLSVALSVK